MNNANLKTFKAMSLEQLSAQTARSLMIASELARERFAEVSDPALSEARRAFNQSQEELAARCKKAMATRPDAPRSIKALKAPPKKAFGR